MNNGRGNSPRCLAGFSKCAYPSDKSLLCSEEINYQTARSRVRRRGNNNGKENRPITWGWNW